MDRAIEQLEWAIRLLVEHRALAPAITLAGAAEEILGKSVPSKNAFTTIKESLSAKGYGDSARIGELMNITRNYMKHESRGQHTLTPTELEAEAIQLITRALINLVRLNRNLPSEARHFLDWVHKQRPELCTPDGAPVRS